jgi:hypothetical protein
MHLSGQLDTFLVRSCCVVMTLDLHANVTPLMVHHPPRDSDPQKLLLGPKKYPLWIFYLVTLLGVRIARAGARAGRRHLLRPLPA